MPYPNEHSARLNDPDKYVRIRRENDKFASGIHAIWGIKEDGTVELQAIRFDKDKFTVAEAKKWLKDHDYSSASFEPASEEEKSMRTSRMPDKDARQVTHVKDARLEAKALTGKEADDTGWVQGYASVWDNIDLGGEIIRKGAFSKSIQERVKAGKVKLMATHFAYGASVLDTIGTITEAEEDAYGLKFKATLASTETAQQVRKLITEGHVTGCSVGYSPVKWNFISMPIDAEGKESRQIVEHIECKLYEVTITPSPMNELAQVTMAKSISDATDKAKSIVEKMESSPQSLSAEQITDAVRSVFGKEADVESLNRSIKDLGIVVDRLLGLNGKIANASDFKSEAVLHRVHRDIEKCRRELEILS